MRHADPKLTANVYTDPRLLDVAGALRVFPALSPLKAIRAKCIDCCCGNKAEVRRCPATRCPLHPYRMGKRPKPVGPRTPAQREADRKNGERLRATSEKRRG